MTPNDIITVVKRLIQDNQLLRTPTEYIDGSLLDFVNQTINQAAILRPDLFSHTTDIATTADTVVQSLPSDGIRLLDIFYVKGGNSVTETDRETMERSYPGWASDPSGVPVNFMRNVKNATQYFLYPAPAAGVVLVGEYAKSPPAYTADQTIEMLPDVYSPALVAGTIAHVLSVDAQGNEIASSATVGGTYATRPATAEAYLERFAQLMGASLQNRTVTDTKQAGIEGGTVI